MADIVTLRAHLGRRDSSPSTHWDGCITAHPICALAWALDEIERLRAVGDSLVAAIRNHDLRKEHLKAWEEACRG